MGELQELESEIGRIRTKKQKVEAEIDDLQTVIAFNEERLQSDDREVFAASQESSESNSSMTDQLLEETAVICWICGSQVEQEQIESTLEQLRDISSRKFEEMLILRTSLTN